MANMKNRRFTPCDLGGEDTTNYQRGIIFFIFAGNLFFRAKWFGGNIS
jgi:hypothetical protein